VARWREVADDLRRRIAGGEFPIGTPLPAISRLQDHYGVVGLNTIRQAQSLLADEGLLDRRHGVGVFVISTDSQPATDTVLAELKAAWAALNRAIALLEKTGQQ
jgi:DNA-binding GntR family transcriptional regulator